VHPFTGTEALYGHRGSRGIALLFLDHGTRGGWRFSVTPRPLFIPGKDPVPIVQEAGWAPGPVWTGAENLAPTRIRSPDRPARSQSLYRLSYWAHLSNVILHWISWCPHKFHWSTQHRHRPHLKCGETWRFSVQKTQRVIDWKARNLEILRMENGGRLPLVNMAWTHYVPVVMVLQRMEMEGEHKGYVESGTQFCV